MHKRLLCSHLHRSLKKPEGTAVLIIFVFCGSEEKRRSKEKQEEEEERQRPDARRKQKNKQEEASQSHRFVPPQYFYFGLGASALRSPYFFAACVHLSRHRGEAVNPVKQSK